MINLKSFIQALHETIIKSNEQLFENTDALLDRFFVPDPEDRTKLQPKTVTVEYPELNADGKVEKSEVQVPIITLVPLVPTQIEKATFNIQFEVEEIDGELQLNFTKRSSGNGVLFRKPDPKYSSVEITITPQETPEGLKTMVEAYERMLKRQIS